MIRIALALTAANRRHRCSNNDTLHAAGLDGGIEDRLDALYRRLHLLIFAHACGRRTDRVCDVNQASRTFQHLIERIARLVQINLRKRQSIRELLRQRMQMSMLVYV